MKKRKPRVEPWTPRFVYDKDKYIRAIIYDENRKRIQIRTGTTDMQEALGVVNERIGILQRNSSLQEAPMSLKEAFKRMARDEWRDHKDYRKRIQTARAIETWFGGDTLLSDISLQNVNDYIAYLRHELENSNATINRKLAVLKRTLNVAMKQWGTLKFMLFIPTFKEKVGGHREFLTSEEFQAILSHCTCHIHATLFLLLYETGMRPSEAIGSEWSQYVFTGNFIKLKDTKNNEDWITPMSDKAAESMIALKGISSDAPFHEVTASTMRTQWSYGREALGKADSAGFTPYALRHTFAKRMLDNGFSTAQVQGMLHHKSIITTQAYTQHSGKELLEIRDRMQQQLENK